MPIVITSPKGQVVIPAKIRKKLKIEPGTKISVDTENSRVILTPLSKDPIQSLAGIFKGEPSLTKELIKDRRAEVKRDEKKFARFLRNTRTS